MTGLRRLRPSGNLHSRTPVIAAHPRPFATDRPVPHSISRAAQPFGRLSVGEPSAVHRRTPCARGSHGSCARTVNEAFTASQRPTAARHLPAWHPRRRTTRAVCASSISSRRRRRRRGTGRGRAFAASRAASLWASSRGPHKGLDRCAPARAAFRLEGVATAAHRRAIAR